MTIVIVVMLVVAVFMGCKYVRGQILDGPGMERDSTDYPQEEPVDGLNKEAILDGPDGTSTHAFTGSKNSVEVDLLDISEMPKTAVRQEDAHFQYAVYVNVDKPASGEGEMDDVRSVWLANERSGTVIKVCVTNPMAEPQWSKMSGNEADGVSVSLTQIAAADKAMIAPGDVSKVIAEGCPDGRNIWKQGLFPRWKVSSQGRRKGKRIINYKPKCYEKKCFDDFLVDDAYGLRRQESTDG